MSEDNLRAQSWRKRITETIVTSLYVEDGRGLIPTTFVPLAPDRLLIERELDVLFGLFHIMWRDMPRPMTYQIRLADHVTIDGDYVGSFLKLGFPRSRTIKC